MELPAVNLRKQQHWFDKIYFEDASVASENKMKCLTSLSTDTLIFLNPYFFKLIYKLYLQQQKNFEVAALGPYLSS